MKARGIYYSLISAFLFGFTPILVKGIYASGISSNMVVFVRYTFAILPLFLICKYRNVDLKVNKKQFIQIAIISIFGHALTTLTLYGSYEYINVGTATTLHFYYPVFVSLFSFIFLKKSLSKNKKFFLLLSTIGVSFFLDSFDHTQVLGIVMALLSAITFAFYMVATEKFELNNMDPFKLAFYFSVFVSIITFFVTETNNDFTFDIAIWQWVILLVISLGTSVLGLAFLQTGINYIGAREASILSMVEPITSLIFGFVFLNEMVNKNQIIGSILILFSVTMLIMIKDNN